MATNLQVLNKRIAAKYPGIELVQGTGRCTFVGADTAKWKNNSVQTWSVQNLTEDEWMDELDYLVQLYRHPVSDALTPRQAAAGLGSAPAVPAIPDLPEDDEEEERLVAAYKAAKAATEAAYKALSAHRSVQYAKRCKK